ncbi:GrpB family protein [Saccharopolyspora rhizosphaerae]|uniref:GrpB family protein n=1 Tax=Saccharopolyspora rhizosphaerae TaxID=2492662 RepID=A0A3R8V9U2_9PSEU|nr:GrpB family protein [Saccharopolyspora rhizosphaerae]RRO13147.1 GrpB family protein [Saccharopolyspora rhizosphaerae]
MSADDAARPPAWAVEDVHLADPDPAWPGWADAFAAEARALLGASLTEPVLHIGSTAVPGLLAKPIVDLQARAEDPDSAIAAAQAAMAAASWFVVPRELDLRAWRRFVVRADPTGRHRLAHLHLMKPDEPRWDQQLAFRDRLRASPALADEYARLEVAAAARHPHEREAYTAEKSAFVRRVLTSG